MAAGVGQKFRGDIQPGQRAPPICPEPSGRKSAHWSASVISRRLPRSHLPAVRHPNRHGPGVPSTHWGSEQVVLKNSVFRCYWAHGTHLKTGCLWKTGGAPCHPSIDPDLPEFGGGVSSEAFSDDVEPSFEEW